MEQCCREVGASHVGEHVAAVEAHGRAIRFAIDAWSGPFRFARRGGYGGLGSTKGLGGSLFSLPEAEPVQLSRSR